MSDPTENDFETFETVEPAIIHVPATVEDMVPPRATDLITEAANFIRAHWPDIKKYYAAISGEAPSIHGSCRMDEAACTFEVQAIAKANGYAMLGDVNAETLRKALRWGFKRNTHIPMWQLEAQNRRLRLTHQPHAQAAE